MKQASIGTTPNYPLEFFFSIHINTAASYGHYKEKALEVKIKGHNGLSDDKKSTWPKVLCNTVAPWRQRPASINPISEERGGVGFYENLNFCFF